MTDVFTKAKRSEVMSRIRGKDTKPETTFRKAMFAAGFRYRIHDRKLPGRPDMVLSSRRVVVFIHGCFWHGHEECPHYRPPKSNTGFWVEKINANKVRDRKAELKLIEEGWRVLVIWECALEGVGNLMKSLNMATGWITSDSTGMIEIRADTKSHTPIIVAA